ncbi:MAG: hypothetical protein EXR75_05250 [Myxococcales bacterium]|nr:hypothetical protein [Myxococcales bacterium]
MASKLENWLTENKIDPRRVVAASHIIERLTPADRAVKLKVRLARKKEQPKPVGLAKPHTGRPLSDASLGKALNGITVSGPTKSRVLRAVNRILEQRKKAPVLLRDLFDQPPPKPKATAASEE